MDESRFDALTKTLSTAHSRRRLTHLLGGLSLGGVLTALGGDKAFAAKLNGGSPCTRNNQCKTGQCVGPAGKKKCSCSTAKPVCKQPANRCKKSTCNTTTNRCVTSNKDAGAGCPHDGKDCTRDECDGNGKCTHPPRAAGVACTDDGSGTECTNAAACDGGGACIHPPKDAGTPCTDDGNVCTKDACDGSGVCKHSPKDPATVCGVLDNMTCDGGTCACAAPPGTNKAVGEFCDPRLNQCASGKCGCNSVVCPCACRNADCVGPGGDCTTPGTAGCCNGVCIGISPGTCS